MDENILNTEDPTPQKEEFVCPDCDQVFAQKRSLLRHDFTVHWERKHICSCGKQFPRKDSLKRHKRGCPGVLIQGTIVNITPYTRPVSTTQENTPSTSKAGHTLQPDYIIRKKIKKVAPWTPPSSSFFPKPQPLPTPAKLERKRALERELFGEDDTSTDPYRSTSPTTRLEEIDLQEDLHLSDSSDSMELSDLDEPTQGPSAPVDATPVSADNKPSTIQDSILEVLSDLTVVQDLAAKKPLVLIHEELITFHTKIQGLINSHL